MYEVQVLFGVTLAKDCMIFWWGFFKVGWLYFGCGFFVCVCVCVLGFFNDKETYR